MTFKDQCDDMVKFCHRAHQLFVASAARCGIPAPLVNRLALEGDSVTVTALSPEERRSLLAETSRAISHKAPAHTGTFPDFLGYANTIRHSFDRFVADGLAPVDGPTPSDDLGTPTAVANALMLTLSMTLERAVDIEQKQTALAVLSALIAATKRSLPAVSEEARDARTMALQKEIDSTIPYSLRR